MNSSRFCAVQVKLELGHRAQVRKKPTVEGFTHDWMVFVRGPEHSNIQHFVEKVVFHLHDSFPRPKRVCKDPPYKVEESGYAGFILPIEVYFKNKVRNAVLSISLHIPIKFFRFLL
uniref:YEATS domain-containing protein n=1 Tax=Naja naja TaxID=35670 RepID=A0A8C6XHP9_NAJNA